MWLRRVFYGWMIPAAFVLPLWLLIGWGVFNAGGWAFLWVLFIAIPSVFVGQLLLTVLVRARATVRTQRAVSWWDVLGFTVWHALTIALGFFVQAWWAPAMVLTIIVAIALFWLELWQLLREGRPTRLMMRTTSSGQSYIPAPDDPRTERSAPVSEVIVVSEATRSSEGRSER